MVSGQTWKQTAALHPHRFSGRTVLSVPAEAPSLAFRGTCGFWAGHRNQLVLRHTEAEALKPHGGHTAGVHVSVPAAARPPSQGLCTVLTDGRFRKWSPRRGPSGLCCHSGQDSGGGVGSARLRGGTAQGASLHAVALELSRGLPLAWPPPCSREVDPGSHLAGRDTGAQGGLGVTQSHTAGRFGELGLNPGSRCSHRVRHARGRGEHVSVCTCDMHDTQQPLRRHVSLPPRLEDGLSPSALRSAPPPHRVSFPAVT